MKILVLNSGSSSIKFQLFEMDKNESVATGLVEAIGESFGSIKVKCLKTDEQKHEMLYIADHAQGLELVQSFLKELGILDSLDILDGIGHRIVQGADLYSEPTIVTKQVVEGIKSIIPLAPLHNPAHIKGIETALSQAPHVPQVVVFDTAYHQTLPQKAYMYAIGYDMYEEHHIRRYGFHGTSHYYVSKSAAKYLDIEYENFNAVSLHLGNGASATAIKGGKSVDTSMGLTPLEGLIMGTRSGDIDPSVLAYIHEKTGRNTNWINNYLNKESGLKGICGTADLRDVQNLAAEGDFRANLALDMATYRIKKYIGSYLAILGRIDAVIFTGGIGENSKIIREMVCNEMEHLGLYFDKDKNENPQDGIAPLHKDDSKVAILRVPTDEEYEIALQTRRLIQNS